MKKGLRYLYRVEYVFKFFLGKNNRYNIMEFNLYFFKKILHVYFEKSNLLINHLLILIN